MSLEDGGNVVLKIEKVAQQINANQHYTIDETSYFVVDLIQNTEYILETLGDADKNVSTSIAIYDVNGMLVTSGNFLKFGRVTFNTGSNNKFNIIVGTNSNLTFVFRIVYASAEDINETVLTIDVCGYTTVANGSYMEFSTASSVELYVYVPNDLASIELYNVDGYVKLIPVVTEGNGYKKYLFQPAVATTYTIFIHLENAEYLPMVLLPANANSNIIVKDATEKIVNDLLNGNTYSFKWNINGIDLPNTILSLNFIVNDVVRQPAGIVFGVNDIGNLITVEFRLFDRLVSREFTIGKLYDLNIGLDVI